jgi:hypothetical protein
MSHPIPTHDYGEITLESVCEKCGHNKDLEQDETGHIVCSACLDDENDTDEWLIEDV